MVNAALTLFGQSQPKLLGAYKLFVNGVVVAMGPGRRVNQTQGVDAVDVASVVRQGPNAIGLQGFHTSKFSGDEPRHWGCHASPPINYSSITYTRFVLI